MKAQFGNISSVFSFVVLFAGFASAQVVGDGIPDVYYFQGDGSSVNTSFGTVTRPAGTLLLDTDVNAQGEFSYDVVAVLVSGPNVSTPASGCDICDNFRLPTGSPTSAIVAGGTYTVGFGGSSTQWVRTNPLSGLGFRGVVGTGWVRSTGTPPNQVVGSAADPQWPADVIDPDDPTASVFYGIQKQGLANYGPGLTAADFPATFDDSVSETLWSVRFASDDGRNLYANVTIVPPVPEPTSCLLGSLCLACIGFVRRQIG